MRVITACSPDTSWPRYPQPAPLAEESTTRRGPRGTGPQRVARQSPPAFKFRLFGLFVIFPPLPLKKPKNSNVEISGGFDGKLSSVRPATVGFGVACGRGAEKAQRKKQANKENISGHCPRSVVQPEVQFVSGFPSHSAPCRLSKIDFGIFCNWMEHSVEPESPRLTVQHDNVWTFGP